MQVCYFPPLFIRILTLPSDFKKKVDRRLHLRCASMRRCFRYEVYSDLKLDIRILLSCSVYARQQLFRLSYSTVWYTALLIDLAHKLLGVANVELHNHEEFLLCETSVTRALHFYLRMVGIIRL